MKIGSLVGKRGDEVMNEDEKLKTETKEKSSIGHRIWTVIGIILCTILIPILIINCILLLKSKFNQKAVPDVGGIFPLIVLTDSMSPEFEGGDLIICKTADADSIKVGDVIAFFDPAGNGSTVVTHRVVEITTDADGNPAWRTKGDANNTEDQDLVPFDNLVGKWSSIRFAGMGKVAMFMQTSTGLIVCVVIPLVLLVGYDIIRRRMYDRKHTEDTEALKKELEELRKLKEEQEASSEK